MMKGIVMLTQTLNGHTFAKAAHSSKDQQPSAGASGAAHGRISDEELIERIVRGDKAAMEALYARHSLRVHRFILRLTQNATVAEDLLSEVFLDVWRSAARFEQESRVSTWLLAIARHKALSALRRRPHESLDEATAGTIEDPADDPETAADKQDRGVIVRKCLLRLSPAHREVLDLVYYHEKSVEEVAEIVGVSPNTVKTRMFYARRKLSGFLGEAGINGL